MLTIVTCPNCGKDTPDGKFCEHCGASVQTTQTFQQPAAQPVYTQQPAAAKTEKNAGIAVILSILFPGSGQVYNGETGKGIGLLIGSLIGYLIFVVPGLIVWLYGIYDAYTTAQKMIKGEIPFKSSSTGTLIGFIIAEIIIAIIFFAIIAAFIFALSSPRYY